MKNLQIKLLIGIVFSWMFASEAGSSSGVILFTGMIVESPCLVKIENSTTNTECYRDGKYHTGTQTLANLNAKKKELPLNLGTTEINWVDKENNLAVMLVAYH